MLFEEYLPDIDLQWFASPEDEGKTEKPTARRLREARRKGRVAKTPELTAALVLLAGFIFISLSSKFFFNALKTMMIRFFELSGTFFLDGGNYSTVFSLVGGILLRVLLPLFIVVFIISFLAESLQVGFHFSMEPLKPSLKKISFTWEKLKTKILISRQMLVSMLKTFLKLGIIAVISVTIIRGAYSHLLMLMDNKVDNSISFVSWTAFRIIMWTSVFFLILSFFDYLYQKYEFKQSQKMTKEEVKRERLEDEVRPEVRNRQMELYRQMVYRKKMLQEVPKADVVITNPTHFAVALFYDKAYMMAPQVVAKGEGRLAVKIKEIAREAGVEMREDRPLARSLFKSVEVGEEIPAELYEAVAGILKYIYEVRDRKAG